MGPEDINPYDNSRSKTEQVREMFDNIAPAYDFMNRAMTFGIDKWWRRLTVKRVKRHKADYILDVATGTGDLALLIAHKVDPITVTGVDISENMLERARRKVAEEDLAEVVKFYNGDCMHLPLPDGSFDAVTVAYGVRNFEHIAQGYSEILRVLKPGGIIVVLELSTPTNPIVKWGYDLYAGKIIPALGRCVSKDNRAYSYLLESIAAVPQGDNMLQIMRNVGFTDTAYKSLTLGTCTIYTGIKP